MEKPLRVKNELNGDSVTSTPLIPPEKEITSSAKDVGPGTSLQSLSATIVPEKEDGGSAAGPTKDDSGSNEDPVDGESQKGIFGWETLDGTSIPYLLRRGRKYVSIRIVERKLLSKYPNKSPDELGKKDPLVSHYITDAEANLLNEINVSHCDYEYGNSSFTKSDLVVDLEEFEEFFKVVKKTFPEEVLASIKGEVTSPQQPTPTPPEPTPSNPRASTPTSFCGWVQINNTVSPYIIRGAGKSRVKLVPLSVIVYAAGLLTNSNIKGILPTAEECKMLNAACKAAGFDFTFARNTRLISISKIVERCPQVQIFELPVTNPLQHAQYLDQRMAPPAMPFNPALRQPVTPPYPPNPMGSALALNGMGDARPPFFMNPFLTRFPGHDMAPNARPRAMGLSGFDNRHQTDPKVSNLDPSQLPVSIQQALLEKCHRESAVAAAAAMTSMSKMSSNLRPPFWPMIPGQPPPPAHSGKAGMPTKTPPHQFNSSLPLSSAPSSMQPSSSSSPSSSSYQPLSLPPNPLLHSTPLDLNHPIYRMPGMQPAIPPKDNGPLQNSKQGPPSSQQSQGSHHSAPPFTTSLFNSSLFAHNESTHANKTSATTQPPPSVITSLHHQQSLQQSAAAKRQTPSPSQRKTGNDAIQSHNVSLVKCISASLVNGKSISCLDIDTPARKGKYCLVEAVSKLYFPAVPIAEFLKVLLMVLNAKLYSCTPDEEAAFVQYYNLPAPRLKCNQMILVEDLTRYFPQLNYVFSKRNENHISSEEASGDRSQKRLADPTPSGPLAKQLTLETVVQKMHSDKQSVAGNSSVDNRMKQQNNHLQSVHDKQKYQPMMAMDSLSPSVQTRPYFYAGNVDWLGRVMNNAIKLRDDEWGRGRLRHRH